MKHNDRAYDEKIYRKSVTLSGKAVTLIPLCLDHDEALFEALNQDEELWRYLPAAYPQSIADMRAWIATSLRAFEKGLRVPFAVLDASNKKIIGSTSYVNMSYQNRHLDIGWTWFSRKYWRTKVNTECKLLMLSYAFETLSCIRVQFRVDDRNEQSKRAVERIGGIKEGVLRKAQVLHDGHERFVALFSILDDEWPSRKEWIKTALIEPHEKNSIHGFVGGLSIGLQGAQDFQSNRHGNNPQK